MSHLFRAVLLCVLLVLSPSALAADKDAAKPLRVYILAGQSNMQGQGFIKSDPKRNDGKGSLEALTKDPATAGKYKLLLGKDGQWAVRSDVFIDYIDRHGPLTVGYGGSPDRIGPELGFGVVMGDFHDEPVLLIKCAWGGKSLAVDFRPPSSGKVPYAKGKLAEAIEANPEMVGKYYRDMMVLVRAALADYKTKFPSLADREPVLSGFGWHQGWNDRINDDFNGEYAANMANFIRDVRKELKAPQLPFVIAESGMTGPEETHPRALSLMKAQAEAAALPEFKGNVAFVGTRSFWRPKEQSPSGQGYHWNTNAETYYLIGEAMGEAMKAKVEKN